MSSSATETTTSLPTEPNGGLATETTTSLPPPTANDAGDETVHATYPERMRQIQLAFIDDPRKAALDADQLASELLQASADELAQRREELAAEPANGASPDTENLRQSVQRYRAFVDAIAQSMHVFSA